MYLPYLRGKQFELLALRELSSLPINGKFLSPVIEPLKLDTRGIQTMIKSLPRDIIIQIIVNPQVGEIRSGNQIIAQMISSFNHAGMVNIIPAFIIATNRDFEFAKTIINAFNFFPYTLIHLNQISSNQELSVLGSSEKCIYNIISVNHIIALRRCFPKRTLVYMTDPFNRQQKNADYLHAFDENFSNDHLYYSDEGFVGFGDYLTIGSEFIDGGRLPWAVAIHLTYEEQESKTIRIRHFVSDSNEDDSDTAGKFSEALDKLIMFIDERNINSIACEKFRDLHDRGAFPGLGSVKKLSIMHHIELVQSLIQ